MQFLIENLLYIIGVVIVATIGGAWMLISTGTGHRLMDMLKPVGDKHVSAKVFCEDNQIRDRKTLVGRYIITDEKKRWGFYLVHKLLLTEGWTHKRFLALTERAARPIDFHNTITAKEWTNLPSAQRVFIDTTADLESQSGRQANSNVMMISLSIIAMMVALVVIIMAIIIFFGGNGSEAPVS